MDHSATLPWTDEQWSMLHQLVQDTARKARVAASFLPIEGPLPPGQEFVPAMRLTFPNDQEIFYDPTGGTRTTLSTQGRAQDRPYIDGALTLPLVGISCSIRLRSPEAKDPDLVGAKQMLRRAADVLGRLEDEIIFNGLQPEDANGIRRRYDTPGAGIGTPLSTAPPIYVIRGPRKVRYYGLLTYASPRKIRGARPVTKASNLVDTIVRAIEELEGRGYSGPFCCVLGNDLFAVAVRPQVGLVLPSETIIPFLQGGPLLRMVSMLNDTGIIIALGGWPIDIVVGTDLEVNYLGRTEQDYLLSVSERFRLRIKDSYPATAPRGPCVRIR
jgi:uncharacterized linocin/CFP29 family protein